ncbi:hypothetical protein TNIN_368491 [Trichonephila inaurata madagascariensis]|uniref:Uncharacterized protein n=1 Tax=Trichonephila inaurata madagascariensis TaxID=2747483 RepID=A0A8X6YCL1_9ARAC|nr:hypothetical protein TNIN_368491 [Trichonephila inaurata madagascariensis]
MIASVAVQIEEHKPVTMPLTDCIKEVQRAVIRFLWSKDVKGVEICQRFLLEHGERLYYLVKKAFVNRNV